MHAYVLYTIFQCEFSCDSDYVIRRLYFENIWHGHHQALFFSVNSVVIVIMSSGDYILKIYNMVITRHCFSVWIQLTQWLCHLETTFWKYMIWSSPDIVFQCEFSCDSDCVSGGYILKMYDMVITRHCFSVWIQLQQWLCHLKTIFWKDIIWSSPDIIFQCECSHSSYYVIWRLYFHNIWYGHH